MVETLKKTCGLIQLSQTKVSSEVGVGVLYGEWLQPPRHLPHLAMRDPSLLTAAHCLVLFLVKFLCRLMTLVCMVKITNKLWKF